MNDKQIKYMVNRFLGWRLPKNFNPDAGISFKANFNEHTTYPMKHEPVGTNLLDATQAEEMVRYLVDGMSSHGPSNPAAGQASPEESRASHVAFGKWAKDVAGTLENSHPGVGGPVALLLTCAWDKGKESVREPSAGLLLGYYEDILRRIAKGWDTPQSLAQAALDHEFHHVGCAYNASEYGECDCGGLTLSKPMGQASVSDPPTVNHDAHVRAGREVSQRLGMLPDFTNHRECVLWDALVEATARLSTLLKERDAAVDVDAIRLTTLADLEIKLETAEKSNEELAAQLKRCRESFRKIGNYCAAHQDVIDASWVAKVIDEAEREEQ